MELQGIGQLVSVFTCTHRYGQAHLPMNNLHIRSKHVKRILALCDSQACSGTRPKRSKVVRYRTLEANKCNRVFLNFNHKDKIRDEKS